MWGCFLMSGVKILHFLKDWWKSIPIHQNYTMALIFTEINNISGLVHVVCLALPRTSGLETMSLAWSRVQ